MHTRHLSSCLLLTTLLAACARDETPTAPTPPSLAVGTGHNSADHFKIDEPVEFQVESPCNGELIDLAGRETGQVNAVDTREHLDNGNSIHFEHNGRVVAAGAGQQTGSTYDLNSVFHESFNSPSPPAPQVTISFRETLHVNGSAPGTAFSIHTLFHLVLQPSADEARVTKDIQSVTCDT
jgi:hypothetical protein